jgi:hypothetical protein
MVKPQRGTAVKDLFGGRSIPAETALASMRSVEERLTTEFRQRVHRKAQLAEQMRKYRTPLLEVIDQHRAAGEAVTGVRRLQEATRDRKLHQPYRAKAREGVSIGSIAATVVPPYDYQWTWSAVAGNPDENDETADRDNGDMALHIWTDFSDNSSSVSARTALGTYFYPPASNGTLQVWSSPSYTDDWGTYCVLDGAAADAWMGLYIESYDLAGAATGTVVDQQPLLWSDSSWWSGTGSEEGSNSGYGLYAPPIQVDQDHQYIIWVWMGGDISAQGWGTFSGSGAGDDLSAHVPSITWELG